MTTAPPYDKRYEGTVLRAYGGAKLSNTHLLSKVHCVDEEIITWLAKRERRRSKRDQSKRCP